MEWITVSDVETELWRRILEFANTDLAIEAITFFHGAPSSGNKHNYQKQAKQIRVCMLQAREYFAAAKASSLFTSPNHLYYGMISLASAIMLIRGDGTKSLDVLRKTQSNNHHGLDFTIGAHANITAQAFKLLEECRVEILRYGHFGNWYTTIPTFEPVFALTQQQFGAGNISGMHAVGKSLLVAHQELVGTKRTLLSLLQFIPELAMDLARFGALQGVVSRLNQKVVIKPNVINYQFIIQGAFGDSGLDALLDRFKIGANYVNYLRAHSFREQHNGCIVELKIPRPAPHERFAEWPSVRRAADLTEYIYDRDASLPEIAESYLFGYGLSMLSRYYPDYWISCIESQGKAAKLIERAVGLLLSKFPLLVLNLISRQPITISTHRAPLGS